MHRRLLSSLSANQGVGFEGNNSRRSMNDTDKLSDDLFLRSDESDEADKLKIPITISSVQGLLDVLNI